MASDLPRELTVEIGRCYDFLGDDITVCVKGHVVIIEIDGDLWLGPEQREDFQRLFMEAERRAEAHAAPAVSETDT